MSQIITDELKEALFCIWNTQIEEADAILATKKDTNARYALHYAENLWIFSFGCDLKSTQEETSLRLAAARKIADAEKKKAFKVKGKGPELLNQHTEATIVYGEALLFSSFHQLVLHDYAKAILNLKESYTLFKEFEKSIEGVEDKIDPDLYILLKFDLGMFMFFLSLLSEVLGPATRKLLKMIGLKGDQEKGLQYLNEVINSNSIRSGFAYSILCTKFLLLGEAQIIPGKQSELERGMELTLVASSKFPLSLSFNLLHGAVLRMQGSHLEAAAQFEESVARLAAKNYDTAAARINVAHCYANMGEWDRAIQMYQEVEASNNYVYPYAATLYKGLNLVMKGKEEEGHEAIQSALKLGKDDSEFKYLAERYNNNGFFGFFEYLYMHHDFKYTPEKAEEFLGIVGEISNKLGINAESRGETPTTKKYKHTKKQKESHVITLNAVKGKLLRLQNRNEEALAHFNRMLLLKPVGKVEKNIYWECLCEAARILLEQNKKAEALPILQKIADQGNPASKAGAVKAISALNSA